MNTNAPEMTSISINGPSIRSVLVSTTKQIDTHSRVRMTDWVVDKGRFIFFVQK